MHNCTVCGQKYHSGSKHLDLTAGKSVNFCPECWGDIKTAAAELSEEDRRRKELFDALTGWTEVVINRVHGGFGLSEAGACFYLDSIGARYTLVDRESRDSTLRYGRDIVLSDGSYWHDRDIDRDDPALVRTVDELGEESWGPHATLKIVRVPADADWFIDEYDGLEIIRERHRIWA